MAYYTKTIKKNIKNRIMRTDIFILLTIGSLLALCTACQPSSQEYIIEGAVRDSSANGKTIYLMRYDDEVYIDSTVVADNHFTFKGRTDTAVFCRIDVTGREFGNLILEGGHIRVNLETYNSPEGTPMNEAYTRLYQIEDSLFQVKDQAARALRQQYQDPDTLATHWKALLQDRGWNKQAKTFFQQHNNDALGESFLYTYSFRDLPTAEQKSLLLSSGPWMRSRQNVQRRLKEIEALENTAEGKLFTDIKGKDMAGNNIALSDFIGKGNYVLMDVWASWCHPCREEIPNLAKLHEQYKDKGLTVIGLFTWDKAENLPKAMEQEKITWPQIIDTENRQAMHQYGISGIPHIILFSPEGIILKRNLRGENMIKTVENILNKK